MPRDRLSLPAARRVALAAQGFGRTPPTGPVSARQLGDTVRRLGVVQIDSVNVLTRAHYLPLFARLGAYDRALLDACSARAPRSLFEYWGHEAALLPVGLHRLMRWRMDRVHDDAWGSMVRIQREQPDLVAEVAQMVRARGPMTATDLETVLAHVGRGPKEHWGWNWSAVKQALEYLFWSGELTSAGRDSAFRRRYAAPQAVLTRAVLDAPTPEPAAA
ncbi:MAG: crosslink repair DNA glycosylase YcaQ family protein, partial [Candidatus Nanopelagicales bacterium]